MAVNNIDNLSLGKLLQIVFSEGVRAQISQDFRDWEMINRFKAPISPAREYRFSFQNTLNPASIQHVSPEGSFHNFPRGFKPVVEENTAIMKSLEATMEIEYDLWDRARKSPEKYTEPLELIVNSTMISTKRRMAADLYGDGTGVQGTVASAALQSPASDKLVFSLDSSNSARGHEGLFEYGDILILRANDGSASAFDSNLVTEPVYWYVVDKDRENHTVTLQGLNASFASAGTISSISVQPTAGDVFYRFGQPSIPDLSALGDYATQTEVVAGLESLSANDGRSVHGISMEGATAGTIQDAGGNPLDVKYIQKVMDLVKIRVGAGAYSWKQLISAPEAIAALIESRETDRRFMSIEDNKRGVKSFGYVHGNDQLELISSEYCPQNRMYAIPEGKATGKKVLDCAGHDFEPVRAPNGDEFHLKVDSSGYGNAMQSFLKGYYTLVCNHPAAIARIENFSL